MLNLHNTFWAAGRNTLNTISQSIGATVFLLDCRQTGCLDFSCLHIQSLFVSLGRHSPLINSLIIYRLLLSGVTISCGRPQRSASLMTLRARLILENYWKHYCFQRRNAIVTLFKPLPNSADVHVHMKFECSSARNSNDMQFWRRLIDNKALSKNNINFLF